MKMKGRRMKAKGRSKNGEEEENSGVGSVACWSSPFPSSFVLLPFAFR
jgi:hypothetical protein